MQCSALKSKDFLVLNVNLSKFVVLVFACHIRSLVDFAICVLREAVKMLCECMNSCLGLLLF